MSTDTFDITKLSAAMIGKRDAIRQISAHLGFIACLARA